MNVLQVQTSVRKAEQDIFLYYVAIFTSLISLYFYILPQKQKRILPFVLFQNLPIDGCTHTWQVPHAIHDIRL